MNWKHYLSPILLIICFERGEASQCNAGQANVTGGDYQPNKYRDSFVIREISHVGPKGCIKECLYHNGCDAVNYKSNFTCELLSIDTRDTWRNGNSFYSEITDWGMEPNQCYPNPCDERCVVAKYGHHVCVPIENRCHSSSCLYDGKCRNTVTGTRCVCADGYSGDICQITPCVSTPCNYGGTCSPNGPSYLCTCPTNYSGTQCEVTPCNSNPCFHQGTCTPNGPGFNCKCQVNYGGDRCEVTPCSSNPCQNQGTCSLNGIYYSCKCKTGFSGTTCNVTPCTNNPCQNGGSCTINGSSYSCSCPAGYQGTRCETPTT